MKIFADIEYATYNDQLAGKTMPYDMYIEYSHSFVMTLLLSVLFTRLYRHIIEFILGTPDSPPLVRLTHTVCLLFAGLSHWSLDVCNYFIYINLPNGIVY